MIIYILQSRRLAYKWGPIENMKPTYERTSEYNVCLKQSQYNYGHTLQSGVFYVYGGKQISHYSNFDWNNL